MYSFENKLLKDGYIAICGVDEAGCGPLAGPVSAAAVILNPHDIIQGLNDSKKLSEKKREFLFDQIITRCTAYAIGWASCTEIDEINILQARFLAMQRAVKQLTITPDFALVDGNRDPKLPIDSLCIVGGDGKSASIAAASIVAKVSRDRYMLELDKIYPQYGFAKHKGYPTKAHEQAILQFGESEVHRHTFLKKLWEKSRK